VVVVLLMRVMAALVGSLLATGVLVIQALLLGAEVVAAEPVTLPIEQAVMALRDRWF
jgi:hypothetical protein